MHRIPILHLQMQWGKQVGIGNLSTNDDFCNSVMGRLSTSLFLATLLIWQYSIYHKNKRGTEIHGSEKKISYVVIKN